jgi:LPS sulfotransferase NodH
LSKAHERQAVAVMSLPRSGSSWVCSVVGTAGEAAYLREPLTYSWSREKGGRTVFDIDASNAPASYRKAARLAFSGIPRFPHSALRYPTQWSPLSA